MNFSVASRENFYFFFGPNTQTHTLTHTPHTHHTHTHTHSHTHTHTHTHSNPLAVWNPRWSGQFWIESNLFPPHDLVSGLNYVTCEFGWSGKRHPVLFTSSTVRAWCYKCHRICTLMSYTSAWSDDLYYVFYTVHFPSQWSRFVGRLDNLSLHCSLDKWQTTVIHIPVIFIVDFVFLSSCTGVYRPSICHMTMRMHKWMWNCAAWYVWDWMSKCFICGLRCCVPVLK